MAKQRSQKNQLQTEDTVRLPLTTAYNTRNFDSSNRAPRASTVGIGIVGTMTVGAAGASLKDKKFVNCFAEVIANKETGESKYYVTKRPGFAVSHTPAAGKTGTAIKVWSVNSNNVISAFDSPNSTIYDGTTSLGAITGLVVAFEETLISGTAYMVMTSTDNTAWYTTGAAPVQITDADFPGNASRTITGGFVFVDGYAFIMDTSGRIYNSDLNSVTAWTAGSYREANLYPDTGIGLAKYKNMIVAFGKETVEFFYNSQQNPVGSPLDRYEQAFIHFGCINQYAFTQVGDTLAWVSSSNQSGTSVYILDGMQPKRISTPFIDSQLGLVAVNTIYMSAMKMMGKTFIVVNCSVLTFVYIVEDDQWHEWYGVPTLWHHLASGASRSIYAVSRVDTSGKVFIIDPTSVQYKDNGTVFLMMVQTTKFDGNTVNPKFLSKLTVIADTTPTSNTLEISYSDDDYQTWSTARTVDLSTSSPYLNNMGKFKRRAFKFTNSVDNPVRLEAVELELKQGRN